MEENNKEKYISYNNLRKGMIVKVDTCNRNLIVLHVTKKDIKRGVNADKEGLYGFGGMWYGRNPMKIKNFGKIHIISDEEKIMLIRRNLNSIKVNDIIKLVD